MRVNLSDTVTRQRGTVTSGSHGEPIIDWTPPTDDEIYPAEVQPISTAEAVAAQQRTETKWKAFLPYEADVLATDRILWSGDTFEVDGEPERWKFKAVGHHLEIFLVRWMGA